MTHFGAIMSLLVGVVVILGVMGGGLRYVYTQAVKRATQDTDHLSATKANTKATQDLSEAFKDFAIGNTRDIADHEHRITVLEQHER